MKHLPQIGDIFSIGRKLDRLKIYPELDRSFLVQRKIPLNEYLVKINDIYVIWQKIDSEHFLQK